MIPWRHDGRDHEEEVRGWALGKNKQPLSASQDLWLTFCLDAWKLLQTWKYEFNPCKMVTCELSHNVTLNADHGSELLSACRLNFLGLFFGLFVKPTHAQNNILYLQLSWAEIHLLGNFHSTCWWFLPTSAQEYKEYCMACCLLWFQELKKDYETAMWKDPQEHIILLVSCHKRVKRLIHVMHHALTPMHHALI